MNEMVFAADCIVDVTNFNEEEHELGYSCSANVSVHDDGTIVLQELNGKILEHFDIKDIVLFDNNINNFDPRYKNAVKILLNDKAIQLEFYKIDSKAILKSKLQELANLGYGYNKETSEASPNYKTI